MQSITINGCTVHCSGKNVVVKNGTIIVDGNVMHSSDNPNIQVVINGDVNSIKSDGSVEVKGNVGTIDCGGSCSVSRTVTGNVTAGGSISCGEIIGNVCAGGSVMRL